MDDLVKGDGRTHVNSGLMRESLVSKKLRSGTDSDTVRGMVPNVRVITVGGCSIMDRGREAILPLVDEIAALNSEGFNIVIGVGGGLRARHTFSIGLDLGLPTGGLARIMGGVEEQNRDMLQFLLAPHGGVTWIKDHFQDLQLFLKNDMIPIAIGQPPYHFWEPPTKGRLPDNGADVGLFLMAEVVGAEQFVLIKDVDGVFPNDPHGDGEPGELIKKISAQELLERDYASLPVEKELLRVLQRAKLVKAVRVINGLDPKNLRRAFEGEDVGTLITAGEDA